MVDDDALRHGGHVQLDGGLDGVVLVLGVGDQQRLERAHVIGERGARGAVGGIDATRFTRHGEELCTDALVDVAVQVEGDELEVDAAGLLGDGHVSSFRVVFG